jgi:hypothetical protein
MKRMFSGLSLQESLWEMIERWWQSKLDSSVLEESSPLLLQDAFSDENLELIGYFQSINTTLLRHLRFLLSELEISPDGYYVLQSKDLDSLGLHPKDDIEFVIQLVTHYYPQYLPIRIETGK